MIHNVFIAIPAHSGQVMVPTVCSVVASFHECAELGWPLPEMHIRSGDADLIRCRNALVAEFLKSPCTDLLMVDSDISWGRKAFSRLVAHDVDFIAAPYRMRTDDFERYPVLWPDEKRMRTDPNTGFPMLAADGVPVGFCRLTRSCVEKLVESLGGLYMLDTVYREDKLPWLFDFDRDGEHRWEEGYSLCRRWRRIGGDVWVDPCINLGHSGVKTFFGNLGAMMEREIDAERYRGISVDSIPSGDAARGYGNGHDLSPEA